MTYSTTSFGVQYPLWKLIKSDLDRFHVTDHQPYLIIPLMCPASVACISHRIGHAIWSYSGLFSPVIPLLKVLYILCSRVSQVISGVWIAPQAEIGPGLYIGHFGTIIIGQVKMGSNCNLSQGVTIGEASRGKNKGLPKIGDRVYIGAGAKLFGNIHIGNDVAVGANAVVTKSLPDRAVAVGVPAQVISYAGSFEYVLYRNMENDPLRLESLGQRNIAVTPDN